MERFLFKSRRGLGDLLYLLPACLHLSRTGREGWIEAPEKWWDAFQLVSYARCWKPGDPEPTKKFDTNLIDFRFTKSKINDYMLDAYPELADVPRGRQPLFDRLDQVKVPDYGLPKSYTLISPFGYSQPRNPSPEWFMEEVRRRVGHTRNVFILTDQPRSGLPAPALIARSVAHLPKLIADAEEFFTVNSSPSIIAGAARKRPYYHVRDHGYNYGDVDERCNYEAPNQIVIPEKGPASMSHPVFESWYAPGGQGSGPGSSPAYTEEWREFLEAYLEARKPKKVVDFGCGDWQHSKLVNWGDVEYLGLEVVPTLVDQLRRTYAAPRRQFRMASGDDYGIPPDTDLVIVKDVFQHLPNAEVLKILAVMKRNSKHGLFVNDRHPDPACNNRDILTGDYRCLDLAAPPFGLAGRELYRFPEQPHTPELPKICFEYARPS